MKRPFSFLLLCALLLSLCACGQVPAPAGTPEPGLHMEAAQADSSAGSSAEPFAVFLPTATPAPAVQTDAAGSAVTLSAEAEAEMFSGRDYDASYENYTSLYLADNASSSDSDVKISGNIITIEHEGCYLLRGSLTDGQILIKAPDTDKVQLVLAGVDIACSDGPALYIPSADKVFITLAAGTENSLCSTGDLSGHRDGADAALFARPDISFNGSGSLRVFSETGHGIVTKDDLKITAGTIAVNAPAGKGLEGKDSIRIAGGSITVTSGKDGLQSEHESPEKGFIYVAGGSLSVSAGNDALQATGPITVRDGLLELNSGGGYENAAPHTESFGGRGGWGASTETAEPAADSSVTDSFKGLKSDNSITVSGGHLVLNCADDALHTNGDMFISGGELFIQTGDDALHADNALSFSAGSLQVSVCYEGLEATDITVSGGYIDLCSSDDGINAAGGNDSSGFGPSMDRFSQATGSLAITGGTIRLNTGGDSLDANGTLHVSGGTLTIAGPSWTGNSILDSDMGAAVYGGTVLASGVTGMQSNFNAYSTQGSILLNLSSTQPSGSSVQLYNAAGELLAEYAPAKDYSCLLISHPGLIVGGSYTLVAGNESQSITMDSLLYGSGGGFGFGGGRGGRARAD